MKKSTPIFQVPQVYIDCDKRAHDLVRTESLYVPAPPLLRRIVQKSLYEIALYHHCSDTNGGKSQKETCDSLVTT